jgi:hypothetical protein
MCVGTGVALVTKDLWCLVSQESCSVLLDTRKNLLGIPFRVLSSLSPVILLFVCLVARVLLDKLLLVPRTS